MKAAGLETRVRRLEEQKAKASKWPYWRPGAIVHWVIQDIGEGEEEARARYERETGKSINEGDGVMISKLTPAVDGRLATPAQVQAMIAAPDFEPHRYQTSYRI